jgi:hypothetical protein
MDPIELDSFAGDPLFALPKEGDFLGSFNFFENQVQPTVPSVMPGLCQPRRGSVEGEDCSPLCEICISVGSRFCGDHSLVASCQHPANSSLTGFSDLLWEIFSDGEKRSIDPKKGDDSCLSSFCKVVDNLAGDPFRPHSLFRDPHRGNSPESILAPSSVSNTASTPKPIQPEEGNQAPLAVKDMRPPTRGQLHENLADGISIRRLMEESGTQHVYFGRGWPFTNHPGNKRFRSIVSKYCSEYKWASNNPLKLEIKKRIIAEVKNDGSKFFVIVVTKNGNVSQKPVGVTKVLAKTGHALRDAWKYQANFWPWVEDPTQEPLSCWPNLHRCRKVKTTFVRKKKHLVDVSSMIMHRADAN